MQNRDDEFAKIMAQNLRKYDVPGPRYTSFPPVPYWNGRFELNQWLMDIKKCVEEEAGVDLYLHIPYCQSLCYYCGCNREITKNHDKGFEYVELLLQEWSLYIKQLSFIKIKTIHLGGGTPTFLTPAYLDKLLSGFLPYHAEGFMGSIEIDPRTVYEEHFQVLQRHGIKRISLGIQDFDPVVQKAINRIQSFDLVENIVNLAKKYGVESINFDLIYGLPFQTVASIRETMQLVNKLGPDLLALYSYAHLPERIKNQRLIKDEWLATGDAKRELFETARELFLANAYEDIGMDHFAKRQSYLFRAKMSGKLYRNFMGYTDKKTSCLIGLGPSAISNSNGMFLQNVKDLSNYKVFLEKNELPIEKGHTQSMRDILTADIIQSIMCEHDIQKTKIDLVDENEQIINDLETFIQDGLIEDKSSYFKILDRGIPFLRNMAMCFDYNLRRAGNSHVKFSQTV